MKQNKKTKQFYTPTFFIKHLFVYIDKYKTSIFISEQSLIEISQLALQVWVYYLRVVLFST